MRKIRARAKERLAGAVSTDNSALHLMKLDAAFSYFITAKKSEGLRERTITDYTKSWQYFSDWLRENAPNIDYIQDISSEICRNYVQYMSEEAPRYKGHCYINCEEQRKGLSAATINIRIRSLKVAFNFWVKEGFLNSSPMDNIRVKKTDQDAIQSFTDEQVEALLNACDQRTYVGFRDYVLQVLLLDTGMRINEALSLREQDIDAKTRVITLAAKFSKNRKPRVIPLSQKTIKLLFELIQENKIHFDSDKIFLSSYGGELTEINANKRLKYYGEVSGVGNEIRTTAHTWRHTAARNMILAGMDVFTVARILGHSSITMTRRYVQITDKDLRVQHEKYSPVLRLVKR